MNSILTILRVLFKGPARLNLTWYFRHLFEFRKKGNPRIAKYVLQPQLQDRTPVTPLDPVYLIQDAWISARLAAMKPSKHVDIGSSVKWNAVVAQFMDLTMIDIRPLKVNIPNLKFLTGSVLQLPFPNNSLRSVSSLCVLEHIGLGRYGDPIDSFGTEKAIVEIQRVVEPGGNLYVSLPVDAEDYVYFNAHRAFRRETILNLFSAFEIVSEAYQYGYELKESYKQNMGFGTGLFHFRKLGEG